MPLSLSPSPPAIIMIAGTSSGVGKTTLACGLMAALSRRGLIVQPFKCGPDFLDAMHHEAAIQAGWEEKREENEKKQVIGNEINQTAFGTKKEEHWRKIERRRTINLDGWMMNGEKNIKESFLRHCKIRNNIHNTENSMVDVCIIEGCMGLYDSKDGLSDDGSSAQIAKYLNASVVLIIDAGMMARSVAPMALGYSSFDTSVHIDTVIANKVGGSVHVQWIQEAIEDLNQRAIVTKIAFGGGMVKDLSAAIPERHLGLTMPTDSGPQENKDRFSRLAALVERNVDIDSILEQGRIRGRQFFEKKSTILPSPTLFISPEIKINGSDKEKKCRVGVARDEAFCFYYVDNILLLEEVGAEIVYFSPIHDNRLPSYLDALYIGGGYPELHAEALHSNTEMKNDIRSFSAAGGVIYAECGGFMYLAGALFTAKNKPRYEMCGVFPEVEIRMTPHMKMHYAEIEFTESNPVFSPGTKCRGQKFHFSEILHPLSDDNDRDQRQIPQGKHLAPIIATPQTIMNVAKDHVGCSVSNSVASYYHLHFASNPNIAQEFITKAIHCSPSREHISVSFVSAATEIIFAMNAQSYLGGVTSICDFPREAQYAPRQIVCRSSIDASTMTSEEVNRAMIEIKKRMEDPNSDRGPGIWHIDLNKLKQLSPKTVFVQNTCDVCDAKQDDVLMALQQTGLDSKERQVNIVHVAPKTLEGLFTSILDISQSLGAEEKGFVLVGRLRKRLQKIQELLLQQGEKAIRPKVLSLEGLAPICTGGNWLPDMKVAAGCEDALGDKGGAPARILTWEEITTADPDVLIISPCSASPQRTLKEIHLLASEPCFWKLRCVQSGNVYIIDHNRFSRPGPRLVSGIELLATLVRGVSPPEGIENEWASEVLKYECNTKCDDNWDANHCTTELAQRFNPVFSGFAFNEERSTTAPQKKGFHSCAITRCTILKYPNPKPRSAHCMIPLHTDPSKRASFLIFSGEDAMGKRLKDIWKLFGPSDGWTMSNTGDTTGDNPDASLTPLGSTCIWEWFGRSTSSVADEDVPTARSNSAAIVCGSDHLLVFGGWGKDNMTPLSACELLHLGSFCWTHCSTKGGVEPPPRGNPTLVYSPRGNRAILFGGWNRVQRLNDLWYLDLNEWQWNELISRDLKQTEWPKNRTDHSAVLWQKSCREEIMIVYGGSVEGTGASDELWMLDCSDISDSSCWKWAKIDIPGQTPPGRSSHTASIVGKGKNASMIILGGSDAFKGCAKSGIVGDVWILMTLGDENKRSWLKLPWNGPGIERCRHTMAVIGTDVMVWGGFDGEEPVHDQIKLWHGNLADAGVMVDDSNTVATKGFGDMQNDSIPAKIHAASKNVPDIKVSSQLQERWEAEIPVRQEDLPPEILEKAKKSKLPNAMAKALHRYAVLIGRDTYIDPASGYSVFTQLYLKRRPCCGNGCRHCPHGHVNVPRKTTENSDDGVCPIDPKLDW